MAGGNVFGMADPYGAPYGGDGVSATAAAGSAAASTSTEFMVWVLLLGIVLPVAIIGGLDFAGFHFVFKR